MGANFDNGMREVNGMRNGIINEFCRLNPNAAYNPPPPPPAPPGAGAVAGAPPPMSEHPDAVYEENALAPAPPAPSNAGSQGGGAGGDVGAGGGGGSAAMSIDPSVHTEPVAPVAEAMDIDNEVPVPGAVPNIPPVVVPQAPQDPFHVGGNPANPVAEGLILEVQNYIELGDADEPLMEQLFPNMDGATATETSSEGTVRTPGATTRSRGSSTDDHDNAIRPMELEFQQPVVPPVVTHPPSTTDSMSGNALLRENRRTLPEIVPPPKQAQITNLNQEEEDDRQLARRPQAWQEYAEQARLDRGLTPQRPQAMHLADMAAAMENQTRQRTRGINNRPGTPSPGSLLLPAPLVTQPEPVFDQTNQQRMLEHMDTPSGAANGTIPGFPEVPADLDNFTFDSTSFPDFPGYLKSGPPTSQATAFIDNYLNAPTSPQGLLEGPQQLVVPEPQEVLVPAAATAPTPLSVVPAQAAAATGMATGTTPKPRSPRRSRSPPSPYRSNPNRLIAPNTPAEGIRRPNTPVEDSTTARSQTPDARAAEEEEVVNAIPTKGPLRVRKDTIAAKKRATQIAKAREEARTQSHNCRSSAETVQRARNLQGPFILFLFFILSSMENLSQLVTQEDDPCLQVLRITHHCYG
jgi:hypothetical protein